MEIINDIVGYNELKIIQNKNYFNFSLESVLLPNFVNITKKDKKVIDLGTGNAPIPLILDYLYDNLEIYGVELQKEIYDLAIKSLDINKKSDKIKIINEDIKNLRNIFSQESFDIVITNPPYFKKREKKQQNENNIKSVARHEIEINIDELTKISSYLLKNKGKFYLVHRTERFVEIVNILKKYKLEPKKVQFIYPKENCESNLFMLEAVKNAGNGLKVLKPLIIHDKNGEYKLEIKKIFNR